MPGESSSTRATVRGALGGGGSPQTPPLAGLSQSHSAFPPKPHSIPTKATQSPHLQADSKSAHSWGSCRMRINSTHQVPGPGRKRCAHGLSRFLAGPPGSLCFSWAVWFCPTPVWSGGALTPPCSQDCGWEAPPEPPPILVSPSCTLGASDPHGLIP